MVTNLGHISTALTSEIELAERSILFEIVLSKGMKELQFIISYGGLRGSVKDDAYDYSSKPHWRSHPLHPKAFLHRRPRCMQY